MNYRYITNKNHREIGLLFTNLPLDMKHHLVETSHSISRHHAALWSSWVCRNIKSPNILCLALFPQTSSPYNIPIRLAIHEDCSPNSSNSSLNPILDLRCKNKRHSLAQLEGPQQVNSHHGEPSNPLDCHITKSCSRMP